MYKIRKLNLTVDSALRGPSDVYRMTLVILTSTGSCESLIPSSFRVILLSYGWYSVSMHKKTYSKPRFYNQKRDFTVNSRTLFKRVQIRNDTLPSFPENENFVLLKARVNRSSGPLCFIVARIITYYHI